MCAARWKRCGSVVFAVPLCALALLLSSLSAGAAPLGQQAAAASQPLDQRTDPAPPVHPSLRVSDVRLEPGPAAEPEPSAVLRFNLENHGITQLADVILRIAIFERPAEAVVVPRAVVRPFSMHTDATLEPGYSVDYEMLFHNLSAGCNCVPTVEIVSARPPRN
jgi:hypothetical protein